jgi:diguanylate cyclase (GGDEF)-like protein
VSGVPETNDVGLSGQLAMARRLLETGDVETARTQTLATLREAEVQQDRGLQGQALMVLAQYDRVVGRFRRAIEAAQRAVQLFQLEGDIAAEADALSLLAHASSYLGRDEDAVEAALLSVRLGDLLPPGPRQVNLHNYLGVAYLWAQSFSSAESSLREAERLALLYRDESNVLLPRINLAWLECVRIFNERYFTGALPDTGTLRQRLEVCHDLFEDDTPFPGLPGVRAILQRFGHCAWGLLHCWEGDLPASRQNLELAQDPSRPGHYSQVANFIVHWLRAEICRAQNDHIGARQEVTVLIDQSARAEFEQTAYLGHRLLAQMLAEQGLHELARAQERLHRLRELRVRADILDHRQRVVETHLEFRSSKRHLQMLSRHAEDLERLSYEDSLTGIANRRHFEQRLAVCLTQDVTADQPLCVALIDLNSFKQVNDSYSHAAGDEVLRSVAVVMKSLVRASDVAARFGGDEFVVLFPRTDEQTALQICARIEAQVAGLRWPKVSPHLQVGLSVGVAQALPGESAADLLQRSDANMFRAKAGALQRGTV